MRKTLEASHAPTEPAHEAVRKDRQTTAQRGQGSLSVISLRSGGTSAMFHEGYSAEEIKRRGRWRSECWRTYVWTSRERNHELAGKMLSSSFSLLASLARYERRA